MNWPKAFCCNVSREWSKDCSYSISVTKGTTRAIYPSARIDSHLRFVVIPRLMPRCYYWRPCRHDRLCDHLDVIPQVRNTAVWYPTLSSSYQEYSPSLLRFMSWTVWERSKPPSNLPLAQLASKRVSGKDPLSQAIPSSS